MVIVVGRAKSAVLMGVGDKLVSANSSVRDFANWIAWGLIMTFGESSESDESVDEAGEAGISDSVE
jgi:hypothetical protein